jgi:hypothetical protein
LINSNLSIEEKDNENEEKNPLEKGELFEYSGLIFHLAASVAIDEDHLPDEKRLLEVNEADQILHKIVNNENKSSLYFKETVESIYIEHQRFENWKMAKINDGDDKVHLIHQLFTAVKPTMLLSTVIDYCGYKVTVLCPTETIDERYTLVHGPSNNGEYFVDAIPDIRDLIAGFEIKMRLKCDKVAYPVLNSCLSENEFTNSIEESVVSIISRQLQVHRVVLHHAPEDLNNENKSNISIDDNEINEEEDIERIYLINFNSFLLLDLFRRDSFDIFHRTLRPEYFRLIIFAFYFILIGNYLFCFNSNRINKSLSSVVSIDYSNFIFNSAKIVENVEHLYKTVIPALAQKFDSLIVIPFDSHSLTTVIHAYGINCRHMGILFNLCKTVSIRNLLLCEMIARSCKAIISQLLRNLSREAKGEFR